MHHCVNFPMYRENMYVIITMVGGGSWWISVQKKTTDSLFYTMHTRFLMRTVHRHSSTQCVIHFYFVVVNSKQPWFDYTKMFIDLNRAGSLKGYEKLSPKCITTQGVPYDYYSIMHYTCYTGSKNQLPTMLPQVAGITDQVGMGELPSEYDYLHINLLYCGGERRLKFLNYCQHTSVICTRLLYIAMSTIFNTHVRLKPYHHHSHYVNG